MSGVPISGKWILEIFKLLWPIIKWAFKALIWLLMLPFKLIGRLLKP
jgi:hypothetical protein